MSQSPSPFSQDDYSPYLAVGNAQLGPPQRPARNWLPWALAGCGCLGLALLLCCGGGVGMFIFGKGLLEKQVVESLNDDPRLREEIGNVESAELNFEETGARRDDNVLVYRVKGSKGTGTAHVRSNDVNQIQSIEVRLPSGKSLTVQPQGERLPDNPLLPDKGHSP